MNLMKMYRQMDGFAKKGSFLTNTSVILSVLMRSAFANTRSRAFPRNPLRPARIRRSSPRFDRVPFRFLQGSPGVPTWHCDVSSLRNAHPSNERRKQSFVEIEQGWIESARDRAFRRGFRRNPNSRACARAIQRHCIIQCHCVYQKEK